MEYSGVHHRKITPLWPRGNATVENFMKPLGKAIKNATVEGKSWKQEVFKFLRNYRATPHVTTGIPPAQLLFSRNIRTLIPEISPDADDLQVCIRDANEKAKMKMYANKNNCVRPPEQFHVGDTVVMRQPKRNKLTQAYHPEPMSLIEVKGTMVPVASPSLGTKAQNASRVYDREREVPTPEFDESYVPSPAPSSNSRLLGTSVTPSPALTSNSGLLSMEPRIVQHMPVKSAQASAPASAPASPPSRPQRASILLQKYKDFEVKFE